MKHYDRWIAVIATICVLTIATIRWYAFISEREAKTDQYTYQLPTSVDITNSHVMFAIAMITTNTNIVINISKGTRFIILATNYYK